MHIVADKTSLKKWFEKLVNTSHPTHWSYCRKLVGCTRGIRTHNDVPASCWWPSIRPRHPKSVCTWILWATTVDPTLPTCRSRTEWLAASWSRPRSSRSSGNWARLRGCVAAAAQPLATAFAVSGGPVGWSDTFNTYINDIARVQQLPRAVTQLKRLAAVLARLPRRGVVAVPAGSASNVSAATTTVATATGPRLATGTATGRRQHTDDDVRSAAAATAV